MKSRLLRRLRGAHQCKCQRLEEFERQLFHEINDAVSLAFTGRRVKITEVAEHLKRTGYMPSVRLLARITGQTPGQVIATAESYLHLVTPQEHAQAVVESDLVDLMDLVPWGRKESA